MSEIYRRAVGLLARREHTRCELERKLAKVAGASPAQIGEVLDQLQERKLLSEKRFASEFVNARMHDWGRSRLAKEMAKRGVPAHLAAEALANVLTVDERERAVAVLARKLPAPPAKLAPKEHARLMRFLLARGFAADDARRAIARHVAGG